MSAATLTSKGQVTLPADIRRDFDLQAGDRLVFFRALSGDLARQPEGSTGGPAAPAPPQASGPGPSESE